MNRDLWLAAAMTAHADVGGWPLVGWCAVFLITMAGTILAVYGFGEHGLRVLIRSSAQTSLILFLSAFTASALYRKCPAPLSRWLLRNRRYLGVSFAVSHFIHLIAIVTLAVRLGDQFETSLVTIVGGGVTYVFIAAMTATSFDRTAAWIGRRAWGVLHTAGAYSVWLIFFLSYAPRAAVESVLYAPFVVLLIAAVGLRVSARRQRLPMVAAALR